MVMEPIWENLLNWSPAWTLWVRLISSMGDASEASRSLLLLSLAVLGAPFQPSLFGHTSYPAPGSDPHPKGAMAQGFVPRGRRGRARQQGRKQTRAGGRKGRGGAGDRYGGGAGPLASLQPPPNFSRPPFDSFPLRRTPEFQNWRRILRARASRPPPRSSNLSASIRVPFVPRLRAGSADGSPAPLLPGLGAPRPSPRRPC